MKITAEFNSNEELLSFISAFGARGAQMKQELSPVAETKKTTKVETVKKEDKPVKEVKTDAPKEEIKQAEIAKEIKQIEQDQKKDEEVKVTKEMVRERLGSIMKAGKQTEVKDLVAKHGASKLPDLKEEEYAAVYEEAEKLL